MLIANDSYIGEAFSLMRGRNPWLLSCNLLLTLLVTYLYSIFQN